MFVHLFFIVLFVFPPLHYHLLLENIGPLGARGRIAITRDVLIEGGGVVVEVDDSFSKFIAGKIAKGRMAEGRDLWLHSCSMVMIAPSSPFFTFRQLPQGTPIHFKESSKGKKVGVEDG